MTSSTFAWSVAEARCELRPVGRNVCVYRLGCHGGVTGQTVKSPVSVGFPSSSASGRRATWSQVSSTRDAARDARTMTVKTVPRCSSRNVVRLALFNARSVGEKSAAVQQLLLCNSYTWYNNRQDRQTNRQTHRK